jgi:carbonic anhydrase
MATPVQENLFASSEKYASSFNQGGLAVPPAKKYLVGMRPFLHPWAAD